MKDYLTKRLATLNAKKTNLLKRSEESEDLNEVKNIASEIDEVNTEIKELEEQIAKVEAKENEEAAKETEEARSAFEPTNALNVLAKTEVKNEERGAEMEDKKSTMEYRKAFMEYVQRGVKSDLLEKRSSTGTSADLGVLLPNTVIQEIMSGVEKVYGQLYSKVKKTNIPGGVQYPIGSFSATFNRIAEGTTVSARQHAGEVTGYVQFSYHIGEIRLARTLLQTVLSVPVFEQEFAKVIVKAYVEAIDKEIMVGNPASHQCTGILTNHADGLQRISAGNIIEFTAAEMADWKEWQKKLFAEIPLSMRGLNPEFVMTANTYEANIKTLCDDNNRPVYNETFNPVDGSEVAKFKGKTVTFVEEDILHNFNDATNGQYFGMYWVPEKAYAINSNLEFRVMEYFDQETNEYVKKAIVINDGKILDPKYIYLLKKKIVG